MKKTALALAASATLALSACTTFDAYTGEKKVNNTTKGAAIGAGIAAVVAYIDNKDADSDKRQERILEAAGGGALIGGGVGYYMDRQEAKLREKLRDSGVSVERDGDNINLIMPGNITFQTDSSDVSSSFYNVLDSVAIVLEEFDKTIVAVSGHTDSTGSDSYNQVLSEKRASSVASYLKSKGVLNERFEVIGFGEARPIADNSTESGREQNRRVEITLLPVTKES
ncbi:OmpA family protein [gamma proteobacterium HTCC5015]|nr:OmpA family protein [gamma proteobacterium HTCC5015]